MQYPFMTEKPTVLEICAGAGGQAIGLDAAGFSHIAMVEIDKHCCQTLRGNRPEWPVIEQDVRLFDGTPFHAQVDLLAGGIPCPPFSIAGKRLGVNDERNLMPDLIRLTEEVRPNVVMLENVPGLMRASFDLYREEVNQAFEQLGYTPNWALLNASDFGVSQSRKRAIMIAFRSKLKIDFRWPIGQQQSPPSVGNVLADLIMANGWQGACEWIEQADSIAPTIVGGSKKHGGPDLGPTGAKKAWAKMRVNGKTVANFAPSSDFVGDPALTVPMVAMLQGFPGNWEFYGKKTASYRQVGNAFPPPVAEALGNAILQALVGDSAQSEKQRKYDKTQQRPRQTAFPLFK